MRDSTASSAASTIPTWWIFRGDNVAQPGVKLPDPPPWRAFEPTNASPASNYSVPAASMKAPFHTDVHVRKIVNTAIHLRRPLLVTGKPGSGKSTLARAIAHDLDLGQALIWPVNTRSTLADGLYRYDAIARLQAASLHSKPGDPPTASTAGLGAYLRLGPLGTALVPRDRPRVLLIDEIDKSDVDFPNDLLHVFETGAFEIPELSRTAKPGEQPMVRVFDLPDEIPTAGGWIRASNFPIVVLTSNGEREFPPAFLRRCISLNLAEPDDDTLAEIVRGHLAAVREPAFDAKLKTIIEDFLMKQKTEQLSTDQLMNAIFLAVQRIDIDDPSVNAAVFRSLGGSGA